MPTEFQVTPSKDQDGPAANHQATLPRELLKWLGSLDLTFPVKNPRRSLSNGYLVAEVLYRYYPRDVPIHGLDTGTGKRSRTSNWGVLERIFAKKGIPVTKDSITSTIQELPGAVEAILQLLYQHVNQRNLQFQPVGKGGDSTAGSAHNGNALDLDTRTRHRARVPEKPGSHNIITTPAAVELLSLEAIPPSKIVVWDLFATTTGIEDWMLLLHQNPNLSTSVVVDKVARKRIEFGIAFKTDTKQNVIHFLSFLWSAFRFEPSSLAFQLAKEILLLLSPILCSSQPQARDYMLQALDSLLPLTQLSMLELKLGHLSDVMSKFMTSLELNLLHYFKQHLPTEIYVYFLAGLHEYHHTDFWVQEMQSLTATLLDTSTARHVDQPQLECGLLCLASALARRPWCLFTPATETLALGLLQTSAPSDGHTVCLALIACDVLALDIESVHGNAPPTGRFWCFQAVARAPAVRDSALVLAILDRLLPVVPYYHALAGTAVRLLAQVRELEVLMTSHVVVHPIPFLAPVTIAPLAGVLRARPDLIDALALGLAAVADQVPISNLAPLFLHLVSPHPDINAAVLASAHPALLATGTAAAWTYIKTLAMQVHRDDTAATAVLPITFPAALLATLAFHVHRAPATPWLAGAVADVLASAGNDSVWGTTCAEVVARWREAVPHVDLVRWGEMAAAVLAGAAVRAGGGGVGAGASPRRATVGGPGELRGLGLAGEHESMAHG
ncbi:spermatogenesis-associated protein 4 [Allomyces javanicus]|nr:spermatogenesis-associated protein 4 [Allomyces javanicus]